MLNGKAQSNRTTDGETKNERRVMMINKMLRENETKGGITMINKISLALMTKKEDLEDLHAQWLHIPGWLKTDNSIVHSAHRYAGTLTIEDHSLVFQGRDTKERRGFGETIPLNKITSISLGFDKRFKGDFDLLFDAQGAKPLRIRYQSNGGRQTAYILTNFSRANRKVSDNQDWYETLTKYVNGKEGK